MRRALAALTVALSLPLCTGLTAAPRPALPHFDWKACPFEGCVYREWTVRSSMIVYDSWKPDRRVITRLTRGDKVTGLTGVVITFRPGVIRMNRALKSQGLKRGDVLLTYAYRGEGYFAVWFKGRYYSSFDATFAKKPDGTGCATDCAGVYLDAGKKAWWAKVKLTSGATGWVRMDGADFDGVDLLA